MKRSSILALLLLLTSGPSSSQSHQESSATATDDAAINERFRRLQEIRSQRAEAQQQINDAERRLSVLSAKNETPSVRARKDMIEVDERKALEMIGKVVLAGVSFCDASGKVVEHRQYFGTVLRINSKEGLVVASGVDGEEITLPPVLEQYTPAEPGTYRLKSKDQIVVVDPDYISTWRFYPPPKDGKGAP